METPLIIIFIAAVAFAAIQLIKRRLLVIRDKYILSYQFPEKINQQIVVAYPHLNTNQLREVIKGLRDYFQICLVLRRKPVAMPSKVVDLAWHEFILFTMSYQKFCGQAFGRFLHHTPAEAMSSQRRAQQGIKNCWREACNFKNINPQNPSKLPLLFAIDKKLSIKGGFHYAKNCEKNTGGDYCASHIGCGSCGNDGCSSCDSGCSGCGD